MTEIIDNPQNCDRLGPGELKIALYRFTGTIHWYRHPINKNVIYTDGVKFFAENGGENGAYWFIDKVASEISPLLHRKKEYFAALTLTVSSEYTAHLRVTDGNERCLVSTDIEYTDMQPGVWKFYLINDIDHQTLLLPGEY